MAWDGEGVDPWLPERLAGEVDIQRGERRLFDAWLAAAAAWLVQVRRAVLAPFRRFGGRPDPVAVRAFGRDWSRRMGEVADGPIKQIMALGYEQALGPGFRWDTRPAAVEHLAGVTNRMVRTSDEVFGMVASELARSASLGETPAQMAARVDDILNAEEGVENWRGRARTVARTEVGAALGAGRHDGFVALAERLGGEWEHGWVATCCDGRTRPAHWAADMSTPVTGQRVPLGQPFIVDGEPLLYPGWPFGSPSNIINCRCSEVLLRPGEDVATSDRQMFPDVARQIGPTMVAGPVAAFATRVDELLSPRYRQPSFDDATAALVMDAVAEAVAGGVPADALAPVEAAVAGRDRLGVMRAVRVLGKGVGLVEVARAGMTLGFNPDRHEPVEGFHPRPGQRVVVLRQGHDLMTGGGRTTRLSKAVVGPVGATTAAGRDVFLFHLSGRHDQRDHGNWADDPLGLAGRVRHLLGPGDRFTGSGRIDGVDGSAVMVTMRDRESVPSMLLSTRRPEAVGTWTAEDGDDSAALVYADDAEDFAKALDRLISGIRRAPDQQRTRVLNATDLGTVTLRASTIDGKPGVDVLVSSYELGHDDKDYLKDRAEERRELVRDLNTAADDDDDDGLTPEERRDIRDAILQEDLAEFDAETARALSDAAGRRREHTVRFDLDQATRLRDAFRDFAAAAGPVGATTAAAGPDRWPAGTPGGRGGEYRPKRDHGRRGIGDLPSRAPRRTSARPSRRDLVAEMGAEKLAAQVVAEAAGRGGRAMMDAIAARQGFDGPPRVTTKAETDRLVEAAAHREMWRGTVGGAGLPAAGIMEQLRTGAAHWGQGMFGSGIYMVTDPTGASDFADGSPGSMVRAALAPDARVIAWPDLVEEHERFMAAHRVEPDVLGGGGSDIAAVFEDPARYAAARGYDAIDAGGVNFGPVVTEFVVLNRPALAVSVEDPVADGRFQPYVGG